MIIGINIPEGAKVKVSNGKVVIVFDENKTKMDLWKAHFDLWVTEGNKFEDFHNLPVEDHKVLELTHKNKLNF